MRWRVLTILAGAAGAANEACANWNCSELFDAPVHPTEEPCLTGGRWGEELSRLGVGQAERKLRELRIEYANWDSAQLAVFIAAILLREAMGFEVAFRDWPKTSAPENFICCSGLLQFEAWRMEEKVLNIQNTSELVLDNVGYEGTSAWFVSERVLPKYPMAEAWNSYIHLPEYLAALPRPEDTPCSARVQDASLPCGAENWVCQDPWENSTCTDGRFVPSWCVNGGCGEIFHAFPTWDQGYFEAVVLNRRLPFVVNYLGSNLQPTVHSRTAAGGLSIFYFFFPDAFVARARGTPVNLPQNTQECMLGYSKEPASSTVACQYPLAKLKKVATKSLLESSPDLKRFFHQFSLQGSQLTAVMQLTEAGGGNLTKYQAACQWVRDNQRFWERWIANAERSQDAPPPTSSSPTPGWVYGILGGAGGVLLIVVAAFLLKRHLDGARMRHLLNNNRIAEESCEAIAELRLEEMAYLRAIPNPNRIQRSFIRIIDVLTEYRSYLPQAVVEGAQERRYTEVEPPTGDVAMVFTDIQQSTYLWETAPDAMDQALDVHNTALRENIAAFRGYEVKTIGDAFMISFQDPLDALRFALHSQEDLVSKEVPPDFQELELTKRIPGADGRPLWGGLRVRMGIHYAAAPHEQNPITGRTDYRGPVCNMAARLESNGFGGAVTISREVHEVAQARKRELYGGEAVFVSAGALTLKGFPEPVPVWLAFPPSLRERKETALGALQGRSNPLKPSVVRSPVSPAPINNLLQVINLTSGLGRGSRQGSMASTALGSGGGRSSTGASELGGGPKQRSAKLGVHMVQRSGATVAVALANPVARMAADFPPDQGLGLYNHLLALCAELCRRTDGAIIAVAGATTLVCWNLSRTTELHEAQGLRFAQLSTERLPRDCRVGLASGKVLYGNVGPAKRRFTVACGRPVTLAAALARYASHFSAKCLVGQLLPREHDRSAAPDAGGPLEKGSRWVDLWGVPSTGQLVVVRQVLEEQRSGGAVDDLLQQMNSDSPAPTPQTGPDSHGELMRLAFCGELIGLHGLREASAAAPQDTVLARVVQVLEEHPTRKECGEAMEPRIDMPGLLPEDEVAGAAEGNSQPRAHSVYGQLIGDTSTSETPTLDSTATVELAPAGVPAISLPGPPAVAVAHAS